MPEGVTIISRLPDEREHEEWEEKEESLSTSRVEALIDGVFAFAMTLMVLSIDVPTNVPKANENQVLIHHLFQIIPDFEIYVLAFMSLGGFWYAHQIQFKSMKRVDPALIWLNIFMMMFIALVPFSTGLAGDYGNAQISALVMWPPLAPQEAHL